jgi:hypothetical protein
MLSHHIDLLVLAILGHFVGDYLWQNQWMATEKSQPGYRGHLACTVHVMFYTIAVLAFMSSGFIDITLGRFGLLALIIAIPHWIIDRWSLAKYWLWFKNGYSMHEVWQKAPLCAAPAPDALEQSVWKVAFAAPVYIVNDNTLHWVCLWFTIRWLL